MDLITLTRFQSLSKDLYKLKDQGIDAIQIKVRGQGPDAENYITLFDQSRPGTPSSPNQGFAQTQSPILDAFPSYPTHQLSSQTPYNLLQSAVSSSRIIHPKNPPPLPHIPRTSTSKIFKMLHHAWRGFGVGFGIKALFNFLPRLIKKGPAKFLQSFSFNQLFNPGRYGVFAGSFLTIFHGVMLLTKHSQDLSRQSRSFIASFLASISIFSLPKGDRTGIAIFFAVRAFETVCRAATEAGLVPAIPHADSLLFGLATAQIVFCWIFSPSSLDKGYIGFLNTHTGNRAQGTQQSLAFLHVNAPIDQKSNSDDPLQSLRTITTFESPGEILRIPGSYDDGIRYGYTKVPKWEKGLDVQQTIDFYSPNQPQSHDISSSLATPSQSISNALATITTPSTTSILSTPLASLLASPSLLLPATTTRLQHAPLPLHSKEINPIIPLTILSNAPAHHRPTSSSLLPEELVKCCNQWHHQRGQKPLLPSNLTNRSDLICQILHPYAPNHCIGGQLIAYPGVLKQGIKTYLPVYLIPALLFRYNTLLKDPKSWLQHTALSTIQSAAFFSNMTFLAHTFSCYFRHFFNFIDAPRYAYHYYLMPGLTGLAAFCAILLEQKSKRIELALFSLSHAVRSVTKLLLISERIPLIPWANAALFAFSIAILISAAMTNPTLLRPSYFSLLRYFLGKETPGLSNIVPSKPSNSSINKHKSNHSATSPPLIPESTPNFHPNSANQSINFQLPPTLVLNNNDEPILSTTAFFDTSAINTSNKLTSLTLNSSTNSAQNANFGSNVPDVSPSDSQTDGSGRASNNKSEWIQEVFAHDLALNSSQNDTQTTLPDSMKHSESHALLTSPVTPMDVSPTHRNTK